MVSANYMIDSVPKMIGQEVYTINNLDCTNKPDFLLAMDKIRHEKGLDDKLQSLIQQKGMDITITTIGNTEVYIIKGKVWILPSLQARIIVWYDSNLHHPGVTHSQQCFPNRQVKRIKCAGQETYNDLWCQNHKITGKSCYSQPLLVFTLCDKRKCT